MKNEIVKIKQDIEQIQKDVSYIKKIIEDLMLSISDGRDAKKDLGNHMAILKNMFSSLPGLKPDVKSQLEKIFEQAGVMI